jgi:glycosyltransferase involved in cell wall biosynthesis
MQTLSIITINYNDAEGLRKTMRSVSEQSLQPYEHIIVDGGSTDGSIDVINSEKKSFTKVISEPDKGIYDAQNKGIDRTTGDYLLFLNSGDYLTDANVLKQISPLLGEHDLVYGNMITAERDGKSVLRHMHQKISAKVLYADTIWHPVSFFRRNLFDKFGKYDLQYKIAADYEFYCRILLKHGCTYKHVPVTVAVFDTSGLSSSADRRSQLETERSKIQDRYISSFKLSLFRLYTKLRK